MAKIVEGIIVDIINNAIFKGRINYEKTILAIEACDVENEQIILPGFIDSHVHIESSMLTPFEYSKVALRHGVVGAVADPHEIANVCGVKGIQFMQESALKTPMKISFGIPSCVPATNFETNGERIDSGVVRKLFEKGSFTLLSEMMNFPGVISDTVEVDAILNCAKEFDKPIDGHAPSLTGKNLKKYISKGISTDHECTSIDEAREKLDMGMKIQLRKSSASNDFQLLYPLLNDYIDKLMLCSDDCHPDDLQAGYINEMVKFSISKGIPILNILKAACVNPVMHYSLPCGLLQIGDQADFIVIDNWENLNIKKTVIDGNTVFDGFHVQIGEMQHPIINNFYTNKIEFHDIKVYNEGRNVNVIEIVENSLLTKKIIWKAKTQSEYLNSNLNEDILKIVVVNRYCYSKPSVGFVKGTGIKNGAIAGSIAHDSHNLIAIGVDDASIIKAINLLQSNEGGLAVVNSKCSKILPLPIAGLMSDKNCVETADSYLELVNECIEMGCELKSPFMTMAFLSLLVIPELKIGDRGLFDVSKFEFVNLQV
jgi:adenine deaminase